MGARHAHECSEVKINLRNFFKGGGGSEMGLVCSFVWVWMCVKYDL